ncbi:site-specific integrase [Halobiforma nitratireducens]|uniref:Putative phage integrase n=1 Tax=Halobiforma nitratireducens JCM 10879 TaxID=1227454 RepID=M0M2B3_9EURY|nr:tyrosine-type recombinase/integrase [Halobiforma nitratireducens]EMA38525.1 putative phage integrase [Halobiforma nitratireducens JCM 10879]
MNPQQHEKRDDMKVWLSQDEVTALLEAADGTQQRIAFALGARCGLRSHEVLDVVPEDIVDTDAGTMLQILHRKGDQFRETPVPQDLATTIRTIDDYRDAPANSSLVEVSSTGH